MIYESWTMSNKWWVIYKWVINYECEKKIISVTYLQWIRFISIKFLLNTIFHFQNAVQRFMHASVKVPTQCIIINSIFGVFALFSIMCGLSGFFTVIFRLFMIIYGDFTKFRNILWWRHRVRKPSKMNSVVDFKLFRHIGSSFTVNLISHDFRNLLRWRHKHWKWCSW